MWMMKLINRGKNRRTAVRQRSWNNSKNIKIKIDRSDAEKKNKSTLFAILAFELPHPMCVK